MDILDILGNYSHISDKEPFIVSWEGEMKKLFFVLLVAVIVFGMLTPQLKTNAQSPKPPEGKRAATYYFYWYRYPDKHFTDPDGSDALAHHPPASYLISPPAFSYADAGWHRRELLDVMDAQIEIVLPVYWGDYTNLYWSQTGLIKLVEAENTLISEGLTPPKIGMFYDTTSLKIQNGVEPDLTTTTGKALFYSMIHDFFTLVPDKSMWARMDGKPIIYLYLDMYVSNYNQSTFDYIATHFATDFGGEVPYIVRETSWAGVITDGVYSWGAALNGPSFAGDLAVIGPGYDDSAVYNRVPSFRDRECGEFYKDSWEKVLGRSASFTVVETWNELHEGTDVAASQEYGRQYIDLTSEYVQAWKEQQVSERPYVWIDLGRYPYADGIQSPNLGDGTWKSTFMGGRQAAYPDLASFPDPSYHIYLNVDDTFIFGHDNMPNSVWVTVEYLDIGTDAWFLQYDSSGLNDVAHVYKQSSTVNLQNSGLWKRITFALPDAYFANRQQNGLADFRLVVGYDGITNFFGRVWVFKTNPSSLTAPDLMGLTNLALTGGMSLHIPITPGNSGGREQVLSLDRAPEFVTLDDQNNGTYVLNLEPTVEDISDCTYRLRLLLTDDSNPALMDAETISVRVYSDALFLPMLIR